MYTHVLRFNKIVNVKQVFFAKLFHILDVQKLCVSPDSLKLSDVFVIVELYFSLKRCVYK